MTKLENLKNAYCQIQSDIVKQQNDKSSNESKFNEFIDKYINKLNAILETSITYKESKELY